MNSPWLDLQRFPGRAHLASVGRHHAPLNAQRHVDADLQDLVRSAWARALGVPEQDLLLCGSDAEAFRLVLSALLTPADVALVAEPAPALALCAILGGGARFVDVGRLSDGSVDRLALARALERHPNAVVIGQAPGWLGMDDTEVLQDQGRAVLLDARWRQGFAQRLPQRPRPGGVLATWVALRDPDRLAEPLLHGVVVAEGTGAELALLQGRAALAQGPLRQAWAVLQGLQADPGWAERADAELQSRYQRFHDVLQGLPGVRVLPRAGWWAAAECLAGNAIEVASHAETAIWPVLAWGAHPLRSLVTVDLGVALPR